MRQKDITNIKNNFDEKTTLVKQGTERQSLLLKKLQECWKLLENDGN